MESINLADTGFVLLCTALVFLMTPGLAIFYGGLAREKNMLTIMYQNFICLGVISILWALVGFSLVFGKDVYGVIGAITSFPFLAGVSTDPNPSYSANVPFILIFGYQMMFAVITPALMTGAFAGRLRMKAYLKLIILWMLLVYVPVAHWIWGGGFLAKLGVIDFAGGIVIHTTAGISALVIALYIGKRKVIDNTPANIPMAAIGTGLLWFGWFGFNAGGAYSPDKLAAHAFINTTLAASSAMITWLFWLKITTGKVSFTGLMVGSVAGLATITPAAGYVEASSAMIIGVIGSTLCYFAKTIQEKLKIDDALEVWRAHGVGGMTGAILIGFFANGAVDEAKAGVELLTVQTIAVAIVVVYSAVITYLIIKLVDRGESMRVNESTEMLGLDVAELNEQAFSHDEKK